MGDVALSFVQWFMQKIPRAMVAPLLIIHGGLSGSFHKGQFFGIGKKDGTGQRAFAGSARLRPVHQASILVE
jgi:hypothetical protein